MADFKVGDIVILKSGGPKMTISKIVSDEIDCQWFHNKIELRHGTFSSDWLVHYKGSEGVSFKSF